MLKNHDKVVSDLAPKLSVLVSVGQELAKLKDSIGAERLKQLTPPERVVLSTVDDCIAALAVLASHVTNATITAPETMTSARTGVKQLVTLRLALLDAVDRVAPHPTKSG